MASPSRVARYHPVIVFLHWIVAVLVVGNLVVGEFILEPLSNEAADKTGVLRLHMAVGIAILVLMAVRLATRLVTRVPPVPHSSRPLRWLARANQWALYLAVFAMLSTGLGMAQMGGFLGVLTDPGEPLPQSFGQLPPHAGHALFATVLVILLALHLAGVAYHHVVKKQNLLSRMSWGRRYNDEEAGSDHSLAPQELSR